MEPDFPCLADEIADPRPDMNIKVAAFTVSEKSINTVCQETFKPIYNYKLLDFNSSLWEQITIWRTIMHCYILNIEAVGLMV